MTLETHSLDFKDEFFNTFMIKNNKLIGSITALMEIYIKFIVAQMQSSLISDVAAIVEIYHQWPVQLHCIPPLHPY